MSSSFSTSYVQFHLTIDLKRFNFNSLSRSKLETCVDFPIQNMSLTQQDEIYDLFGISNHMGGLGGGHYNAHILNSDDNQWYIKDDSTVTKCQTISPMPSAYVLFYRKR